MHVHLSVLSTAPLLAAVCQAYSHLVSLLPEPASYLEATANLLTSLLVHTELDRYNIGLFGRGAGTLAHVSTGKC